jgi:hypothetical protein
LKILALVADKVQLIQTAQHDVLNISKRIDRVKRTDAGLNEYLSIGV